MHLSGWPGEKAKWGEKKKCCHRPGLVFFVQFWLRCVRLRAIACDCMRLHATTCDNMRQHARGRSPASEQLGASQMVQRGYTGF